MADGFLQREYSSQCTTVRSVSTKPVLLTGRCLEERSPERDGPDSEGVVVDARGGEPNPQHVLLRGDVVGGGDALQVAHVAEREN